MLKCPNWNVTLQILNPNIQGKNASLTYPIVSHYPCEPKLSENLKTSSNSLAQVRC